MLLPAHLAHGTPSQQAAYRCLQEMKLFERLARYDPCLAGTVPLDIQIPGSDLDVLFEVVDLTAFEQEARVLYAHYQDFHTVQKLIRGQMSSVIRFQSHGWPIELFAQDQPVKQQFAYRHMMIEARILSLTNAAFKAAIIALKRQGHKTEPAFAQLMGLTGDPYLRLLDFESLTDTDIQACIPKHLHKGMLEAKPQQREGDQASQ